jgi:uncharacterized coiled-coil DUF342 family protein
VETPILVAIVALLAAPIASFFTWMLNKRQGLANIYNSLSETQQNAVETVGHALQTVRVDLDNAHQKIDQLINENQLLRESIEELKTQNRQLLSENEYLRKQVVELTNTLQELVSFEKSLPRDS